MTDIDKAVPEPPPPLRGVGPRVFISYSFRDSGPAGRLAAYLRDQGMQVRMEDESSLLASPLSRTLRSRIAGAEVFVQILTEVSARSAWVAREFAWATTEGPEARPRVVLPIVVGAIDLPDAIADWVYLPAPGEFDDQLLDAVRRAAMRSVAVLPVDPDRPYQLAKAELLAYCSDPAAGDLRLITDPAGVVLSLIRDTVAFSVLSGRDEWRQMARQQRHALERFAVRLAALDVFLREFAGRSRPLVAAHWPPEDVAGQLAEIVQRLVRLSLGSTVLDLFDNWGEVLDGVPAAAATNLGAAVAEADLLQAIKPGVFQSGHLFWALGGTPGQRWLDLGFDGKKGIDGAHVYLPQDHFDEIGVLSLTSAGDAPAGEVTVTDWLLLGLPQVAAARLPAHPSDVPEVAAHLGWTLGDYRASGRY